MSESSEHVKLVQILKQYIESIVPENAKPFIQVDQVGSDSLPVRVLSGRRPDVYFCFGGSCIIGEAKTDNDVERSHSLIQYKSYLEHVSAYDGTINVVIAVSWRLHATIKNIMRDLKKAEHYDDVPVTVIDNTGMISQI